MCDDWTNIYTGNAIIPSGIQSNIPLEKYFKRLALNTFKWTGPSRYMASRIENLLYEQKYAVIYDDPKFGLSVGQAEITGWGSNYEPKIVTALRVDGSKITGLTNGSDCVVIQDTMSGIGSKGCLHGFEDIEDTQETIRVQVGNQKTPMIFGVADIEGKSKAKLMKTSIEGNAQYVVVDSEDPVNMSFPPVSPVFNIDQLESHILTLMGENLEMIGIDTSDDTTNSKDRLLVDEIKRNNVTVDIMRNDRLWARQYGAEDVNTLYGVDWSVEWGVMNKPIQEEVPADE